MSYQVWMKGGDGNDRHVDDHDAGAPDQGEWLAFSIDGEEQEGVVIDVRYIRQRDGSYMTKVFVRPDG